MSDQSCILFMYQLDGKGGCAATDNLAITDTGTWTHVDYSVPQAQATLMDAGLEEYVANTLVREESRPHAVAVGEGLMLVLRGINRNAGGDPEDMVSVRIWVDSQRMISVRQRRLMAARETADALLHNQGPATIPDLLIAIISNLADGIAGFVDDLEARMELLENAIEVDADTNTRSEISAIRRETAAVRRYLAPQRDALDTLARIGNKLLDTEQLFALREQSDRIARYIEDLDLVRERSLVTQEELMNLISQEAERAHLCVIGSGCHFFCPITFISGVFGMNTAGLPGLETETAFWWVAGAMLLISIAVVLWLRAKKWF